MVESAENTAWAIAFSTPVVAVFIVLVYMYIFRSPEALSLHCCIVRLALKSTSLKWPRTYLIAYNVIIVEGRWWVPYHIRISFDGYGMVTVSDSWENLPFLRKVSLHDPNAIDDLGGAIFDCIMFQIGERSTI